MIDEALVTRKLALVVQDLQTLEPYANKALVSYLASPTDELVVERLLERTIGRMIDVNFHFITESGHAPPRDYFESFVRMGELGFVPGELARRLAPAAGLRNRIAHEYDVIDPERVHAALATALVEMRGYVMAIEGQLPPVSDPERSAT
jgi:uncharacterized protein YutE (UPF0331/DUF86 family)